MLQFRACLHTSKNDLHFHWAYVKTLSRFSERFTIAWSLQITHIPGVPKNGPLVLFDDNFGKYGPILTIFFTQKLSYFSHLTFIMLPFT